MGVFQGWKMCALCRSLLISPPRASCFNTYHETDKLPSFLVAGEGRNGVGMGWKMLCFTCVSMGKKQNMCTRIFANHNVTPY